MLDQDTTVPVEEWRQVVGWEGLYSVSSWGRVRSDRTRTSSKAGRLLKLSPDKDGYLRVGLYRVPKLHNYPVHDLVCAAFVAPRPEDMRGVNHIDTIKTNNVPGNLEWATHDENMAHAARMGLTALGTRNARYTHPETSPRGERHGRAKLNETAVRDILTSPLSAKELARKYDVAKFQIYSVRKRNTWRHVTLP